MKLKNNQSDTTTEQISKRKELDRQVKEAVRHELKEAAESVSHSDLIKRSIKKALESSQTPVVTIDLRKQSAQIRHLEAVAKRQLEIEEKRRHTRETSLHIVGRAEKKIALAELKSPALAEKIKTYVKRTRDWFNTALEREMNLRRRPALEEKFHDLLPALHHKGSWIPVRPNTGEHLPKAVKPSWNDKKTIIWSTLSGLDSNIKTLVSRLESPTRNTKANLRNTLGHMVISMPEGVRVGDDQAVWMAQRYLVRMGVDINQHAIAMFRHDNTDKQHFHVIYNRVRADGGVHHLFGAWHAMQLEAAVQDKMFGVEPRIKPSTAYKSDAMKILAFLAEGKLQAEIRYGGNRKTFVNVTGEDAQGRLDALGFCEQEFGGGFVKHQYFTNERSSWLIQHCAK